jgi:hypothetical protein
MEGRVGRGMLLWLVFWRVFRVSFAKLWIYLKVAIIDE